MGRGSLGLLGVQDGGGGFSQVLTNGEQWIHRNGTEEGVLGTGNHVGEA